MKKEELEQFVKDYAQFVKDCRRVADKLATYDKDHYGFCEHFYINKGENGARVCAEGDEYWNFGGHEHHYCTFDLDLLTYTDSELDAYVKQLIDERFREELREKIKNEQETKKRELETLKRLKEKYES